MQEEPVDLWVYDDNVDPESSRLLRESGARILPALPNLNPSAYRRGEDTHKWDVPTFHRVAKIKNAAIEAFSRSSSAEHLFLIDSDVLIRPGTIDHLRAADLPIIASVYWTAWFPHKGRGPNMFGSPPEPLTVPGHHEVKGLGACTLIERKVLRKARFDPVPRLGREGEDRWFCYLARKAGYRLVMCAGHFEPFHVYRDSEIPAGRRWSANILNRRVGTSTGISKAARRSAR